MPYIFGIAIALATGALASTSRLDRERSFYATTVIVVASYYVLFAAIDGSVRTALLELVLTSAFIAAAIAGFRTNLWIVASALAAHGVLDAFHAGIVVNRGVPAWWPAFCLAYDVTAAFIVARLIVRARTGRHRFAASIGAGR